MNMREEFEARMRKSSTSDLTINRFGNYRSTYVQNKWNDFKAGYQAALAAQAQQETVKGFQYDHILQAFEQICGYDLAKDQNNEYLAQEAREAFRWLKNGIDFAVGNIRSQAQQPDWLLKSTQDLATHLWEKHYKSESPVFEVLNDLAGVISQIDNMTTGLVRLQSQAQQPSEEFKSAALQELYNFQEATGCDVAAELKPHQLAQAQQESQWISVEERLPEGYKPVIVVTNFGDVYACRLPVIIAKNSKEESSVGKRERFTHWMPLPPAPEGGD